MAEPLNRQTDDSPSFDTYPQTAPELRARRPDLDYRDRTNLHEGTHRAGNAGRGLGRVLSLLREGRDRLRGSAEGMDEMKRKFGEIRSQAGESMGPRAEDLKRRAREMSYRVQDNARRGYDSARTQARRAVNDYPLESAAVIVGLGFLLGAALRIRRSRNAY